QVARERNCGHRAPGSRRRWGRRPGFRMTSSTNGFQPGGNRDPLVELLCFQQTIVGSIEVVALDVETGERQTMTRRLLRLFVRRGDFAHALTQRDRPRVALQSSL